MASLSREEFCFENGFGMLNRFLRLSFLQPFCLNVVFVDFSPPPDNKTDSWSSCSEILKQNRLVN